MRFDFFMVPRKRLELLHLAATASKTVMSTIPSPGQLIWIFNFSRVYLVLEMGFEPTHPKAYASETYVSTIPPPEQIITYLFVFVRVPLSYVAPFHGCSHSGVWLSTFTHLPFHHPSEQR